MLTLIRAAAGCKDKELDGKYLARAVVSVGNTVLTASADITVKRKRLFVVKAAGETGELTLYLMSGADAPQNSQVHIPDDTYEMIVSHDDIEEYLKISGDTNPVHTGECPVVPGFLMLMKLIPHTNISADARFYMPVYSGERLYVRAEKTCITVYSERGIALQVKININQLKL